MRLPSALKLLQTDSSPKNKFCVAMPADSRCEKKFEIAFELETNLASRWEGVRLPWASGKSPDFPGSSPNFPGSFSVTSPEVLSLWNLTAIQGFPGSFPDFPGSSPDFPGSFPDFPGGQPFLWEAWHPLLTRKNFPWLKSQVPNCEKVPCNALRQLNRA